MRAAATSAVTSSGLSTLPVEDLPTRYAAGRVDSPLNTIAEQWDEIAPSTERFAAMNDRALAEIERLAAVDDRRNIFAQSQRSYTLRHIREFDGKDFEVLVAWLTQRDGLKVIRQHGGTGDRGADVISQTPDGRRVVVQCQQGSQADCDQYERPDIQWNRSP
ncbi:hypothetical protein GCM10023080_031130 [Streptomyces pseudoechinosporeus]